jgi:transcription-repair coupling factor (superfamily II helicase)
MIQKEDYRTLEEFSDLGSGFQIAMRRYGYSWRRKFIRKVNKVVLLQISDLICTHKILDEAIQELKFTDFKDLFKEQIEQQTEFVRDCTIETDCEMLIPHNYVANTEERLKTLYRIRRNH